MLHSGCSVFRGVNPNLRKKILKYFNGKAISRFTVPKLPTSFANLDLISNDPESVLLSSSCSSLQYCHKLHVVVA